MRAWYVFRHADSGASFKAEGSSNDATSWIYTLKPSDTSKVAPGVYAVALIIEGSATRTTESRGSLTILEPLDRPVTESHAAKMVRLLQRHLEGRIDDEQGRGLESYSIAGVPITKLSHADARSLLVDYRKDLASEIEKRRSEMGLGTGRIIQLGFQS